MHHHIGEAGAKVRKINEKKHNILNQNWLN